MGWRDELKTRIESLTDGDYLRETVVLTSPSGRVLPVPFVRETAYLTVETGYVQTESMKQMLGRVNGVEVAGVLPGGIMLCGLDITTEGPMTATFGYRRFLLAEFFGPDGWRGPRDTLGNPPFLSDDFAAIPDP